MFNTDPLQTLPNTAFDSQLSDVALYIPDYKSGNIFEATLEAVTRIFPPEDMLVIANGN
ncbi:uncharacterized protein RAG0_11267 [Rhynchosporium agropyri]|uniref:Uncharacterized protein n=1 Tax=Rhynchosporium agropyri TaxID=914238 RepID=A0A1E1L3E5_9HELO|nr:uncharacterized protein RAG0_11267 [Rhynchosporium agropyri]